MNWLRKLKNESSHIEEHCSTWKTSINQQKKYYMHWVQKPVWRWPADRAEPRAHCGPPFSAFALIPWARQLDSWPCEPALQCQPCHWAGVGCRECPDPSLQDLKVPRPWRARQTTTHSRSWRWRVGLEWWPVRARPRRLLSAPESRWSGLFPVTCG